MAFAGVVAVGGFVDIGAAVGAEIGAVGVGEELRVDDGEVVLAESGGIVAELGIIVFLEGIVHGVDGGFALVIARHGGDVGLLDEEENDEQGGEGADDGELENGKALAFGHGTIIAYESDAGGDLW